MATTRRGLFGLGGLAILAGCSSEPARLAAPTTTGLPARIACLDWERAEDLLQLGVQPVAMPQATTFGKRLGWLKPSGKAQDIGRLPDDYDLDALRAASPDLILGTSTVVPALLRSTLEEIAPLELMDGATPSRALASLRGNLEQTAQRVGRVALAEKQLRVLDATISRTRLALVGRRPESVALARLSGTAAAPVVKLFTTGTALGRALEQVGITTQESPSQGIDGIITSDLGVLRDHDRILWFDEPESRRLVQSLAELPAWRQLPAVRSRAVAPILEGRSPTGGVGTVTAFLGEVAKMLPGPRTSASPTASGSGR